MDRNNTNSMRELVADSVFSILGTTAADGKTYKTQYYNLDAIHTVGYRQPVNSSLKISIKHSALFTDSCDIGSPQTPMPILSSIFRKILDKMLRSLFKDCCDVYM